MEREVSKIVPSFLASGIAYKSKTAVNNQWGRFFRQNEQKYRMIVLEKKFQLHKQQ